MNDNAHVFFVHAHTKGIGGNDDAQVAFNKTFLDVGFFVDTQSGMKVFACPVLLFKKLTNVFCAFTARDKDDGATCLVIQFTLQDFMNADILFAARDFQYFVIKVVAFVPSHKFMEGNAKVFLKMFADFFQDIWLGCRGKATDSGQVICVMLFDEFGGIKVIRTEIMPPFGKAMRLVKNKAVYLSLLDGAHKAAVTKLLRSDKENTNIAQGYAVEDVGALGNTAHAV